MNAPRQAINRVNAAAHRGIARTVLRYLDPERYHAAGDGAGGLDRAPNYAMTCQLCVAVTGFVGFSALFWVVG